MYTALIAPDSKEHSSAWKTTKTMLFVLFVFALGGLSYAAFESVSPRSMENSPEFLALKKAVLEEIAVGSSAIAVGSEGELHSETEQAVAAAIAAAPANADVKKLVEVVNTLVGEWNALFACCAEKMNEALTKTGCLNYYAAHITYNMILVNNGEIINNGVIGNFGTASFFNDCENIDDVEYFEKNWKNVKK